MITVHLDNDILTLLTTGLSTGGDDRQGLIYHLLTPSAKHLRVEVDQVSSEIAAIRISFGCEDEDGNTFQ